jgi:hypothetical protein
MFTSCEVTNIPRERNIGIQWETNLNMAAKRSVPASPGGLNKAV